MLSSKDDPSDGTNRVQTGRSFEKLAARFFQDQGFEILERNWHDGPREIDLIVSKDSLIVFVEVKSTSSRKFGHPVERVDKRKVYNIVRAAQRYLVDEEIHQHDFRFDVVTFTKGQLEHFPDAFTAPE
ncbi:MAG: YraN family protein [candidate division Zixibacteria bacterium]|nr:YraN family protein [candidate division Zixibacteria bacterium]